MRILRQSQQKEMLVVLAMIQHRVMEALPAVIEGAGGENAKLFFDSTLDHVRELANAVDPEVGLGYICGAFEASRDMITERKAAKIKEAQDEQGDTDRESGE